MNAPMGQTSYKDEWKEEATSNGPMTSLRHIATLLYSHVRFISGQGMVLVNALWFNEIVIYIGYIYHIPHGFIWTLSILLMKVHFTYIYCAKMLTWSWLNYYKVCLYRTGTKIPLLKMCRVTYCKITMFGGHMRSVNTGICRSKPALHILD